MSPSVCHMHTLNWLLALCMAAPCEEAPDDAMSRDEQHCATARALNANTAATASCELAREVDLRSGLVRLASGHIWVVAQARSQHTRISWMSGRVGS